MRQRLISVVIGCIGVLTTTSASAAIVVNSNGGLAGLGTRRGLQFGRRLHVEGGDDEGPRHIGATYH